MSEEIDVFGNLIRSYNLKNLYLDPNNYRFIDDKNYFKIDESQLIDNSIQKRTRTFIEGQKRENIKDLLASFKANGFLDFDIIKVCYLENNNYLVLDGNRRVATLKALQEDLENGLSIGNLNPSIFKNVPFLIHDKKNFEKYIMIKSR